MLIGVQNDSGWRTLVTEVLGVPELAEDPRFVTNMQRVLHRTECDALVGAADREMVNRRAGRPADSCRHPRRPDQTPGPGRRAPPIARPRPVAHDRHRARPGQALLPPATFSDIEACMGDVPALGQHTQALLVESGLDAAQADDLMSRGVARQHFPSETTSR